MPNELRQSLSLLPRSPETWIWIAKPSQSGIKKFICRRSVAAGALSVERPAKYELRRTIVFSSHSSEPMVDERRFSDSAPGNNCNNIDLPVGPCIVQEAMSSSRPKTSLPVTGSLAMEIFFGPDLAGGFRVPIREALKGVFFKLWRVILRRAP